MPLQDGSFHHPAQNLDEQVLLGIRSEAKYYGLHRLVEKINAFPFGVRSCYKPQAMHLHSLLRYLVIKIIYYDIHFGNDYASCTKLARLPWRIQKRI